MSYGIADEYKKSNVHAECDCSVAKLSKMLVQYYALYLILNFVGIMFSTNQGKDKSYNVYSHPNIPCAHTVLATSL